MGVAIRQSFVTSQSTIFIKLIVFVINCSISFFISSQFKLFLLTRCFKRRFISCPSNFSIVRKCAIQYLISFFERINGYIFP